MRKWGIKIGYDEEIGHQNWVMRILGIRIGYDREMGHQKWV